MYELIGVVLFVAYVVFGFWLMDVVGILLGLPMWLVVGFIVRAIARRITRFLGDPDLDIYEAEQRALGRRDIR